jgi:hypothetical protein
VEIVAGEKVGEFIGEPGVGAQELVQREEVFDPYLPVVAQNPFDTSEVEREASFVERWSLAERALEGAAALGM